MGADVTEIEEVREFLEGNANGHVDTHLHNGRLFVVPHHFFDTQTRVRKIFKEKIEFLFGEVLKIFGEFFELFIKIRRCLENHFPKAPRSAFLSL